MAVSPSVPEFISIDTSSLGAATKDIRLQLTRIAQILNSLLIPSSAIGGSQWQYVPDFSIYVSGGWTGTTGSDGNTTAVLPFTPSAYLIWNGPAFQVPNSTIIQSGVNLVWQAPHIPYTGDQVVGVLAK